MCCSRVGARASLAVIITSPACCSNSSSFLVRVCECVCSNRHHLWFQIMPDVNSDHASSMCVRMSDEFVHLLTCQFKSVFFSVLFNAFYLCMILFGPRVQRL